MLTFSSHQAISFTGKKKGKTYDIPTLTSRHHESCQLVKDLMYVFFGIDYMKMMSWDLINRVSVNTSNYPSCLKGFAKGDSRGGMEDMIQHQMLTQSQQNVVGSRPWCQGEHFRNWFHANGPYDKIPTMKKQIRMLGFTSRLSCHLLYGSVSKGLETTKFTNSIGWIGYWLWSRFSRLDRHLDR